MRIRTIAALWLPLAVSFELMMLEGPAVQAAIGRLPHASLHLAAWGLTMSLSLLVESPVIMLLATAIALVRDGPSYRALRRFTLTVLAFCTALAALLAFTPLYGRVALGWMGQPTDIATAARPALQIMIFWTAAIAWRRFHQGILIRRGQTRKVSWGTAIRLAVTVATALSLAAWGPLPGAQVGGITLMAAVLAEAMATTFFAAPLLRREVLPVEEPGPALSQRAILRFHAPLALTTLLTLVAQPMTAAALARLPMREATLAAWPVVATLLLVMRGWGFALQEITVARGGEPEARRPLARFAWLVGIATTVITALIALTPLLGLYLTGVVRLAPALRPLAQVGIAAGCLLPLLTSLGSSSRGRLMALGCPKAVYHGMALNLTFHAAMLLIGLALRMPGMWLASIAYSVAAAVEYGYLTRRAHALQTAAAQIPEVSVEEVALAEAGA